MGKVSSETRIYIALTILHCRSVHNIRIERLWVDVTAGFGSKWKLFFQALELHDGLNTDSDSHIWLLHHLFLSEINQDALKWAEAWNQHTLSIRGERDRSPRDMWFFGMLQNGVRGVQGTEELPDEQMDGADLLGYGVDWAALEEERIRAHHDEFNQDPVANNPFMTHEPEHLSHVEVKAPTCPLTDEQLEHLDSQLNVTHTHSIAGHRLRWITALRICQQMFHH